MKFTNSEKELMEESLRYTLLKFEDYLGYPNKEFKEQRIKEVKDLIQKIKKG